MIEQIKAIKSNIAMLMTPYINERIAFKRLIHYMKIQEEKNKLNDLNKKVMEDLCQI